MLYVLTLAVIGIGMNPIVVLAMTPGLVVIRHGLNQGDPKC